MIRATEVIALGDWRGDPADTVVLDFDDRHRRRFAMEGVGGLNFLLDLHEAVALRTGDALKLEDGRIVEVVGASEPLAEIRAESPEHLLRLAWHLGNRHLPVQVAGQKLRIRRDHVIEAMVQGLGGQVRAIEAAFDPEGGAYAQATHAHHHGHDHHHDHHDHGHHQHDHGHKHDHGHSHAHAHAHAHAHGEGCGCGHHHDHDHHHEHGDSHHQHGHKHG
ncbi:MAG: urease accessory protein UreE [Methylobacterium sp.]|nr:urease accessory protein UreE [Methylobacterium sp.]